MKIGILTFPHSPSYGASLQMFALYSSVKHLGFDVEIINYQNTYMSKKKHVQGNRLKNYLSTFFSTGSSRKFKIFEKQMAFFPKKRFSDKELLKDIEKRFDLIIVGSDQVWNPGITGEDLSYFLNFCNSSKKIAYAASFGVSHLPQTFEKMICELINDIPSLGVRENDGAQIVKSLTNREIPVVLDPTFLPDFDIWLKITSGKVQVKTPYILNFIFNNTKENMAYLEQLSKAKSLPIITISNNPFKKSSKMRKFLSGIGPKEFLNLIKNSEFVVTDSFHGTAFSIIFRKDFYVSMTTKTNSRLETLLTSLGLQDRIISCDTILGSSIDYRLVKEKEEILREKSLIFLKKSITKDK